ncbi:MAG: alkaline phosphatase family protein [bacterium]
MGAERKLLILGLDGATFAILDPLIDRGEMPCLKRIISEGCSGKLKTVFPPVTPVAWASFMTGRNPGKHGVFEFFQGNPLSRKTVNSRSLKIPTLWETLSRQGKRVNLFNLPLTYPIKRINGSVIGGFLAPDNAPGFSRPEKLIRELEAEFGPYPVMPKLVYTPGNELEVIRELREMNDYHFQVARKLTGREDWDLTMYHFIATDRLQHECWHLFEKNHPRFIEFYHELDKHLEKLVGSLEAKTNLMIVSDHGFGPIRYFMDLNAWLRENGYLRIKREARSRIRERLHLLGLTPSWLYRKTAGLGISHIRLKRYRQADSWWLKLARALFLSYEDIDWSRTRAYSQGNFGQIFLNRAGRQPQGIVGQGREAEELIEEISRKLGRITAPRSRTPLIKKFLYGNETYQGKYACLAPDISFLLNDMSCKPAGTLEFSSHRLFSPVFGNSGDHYLDGVFIAIGPLFKSGLTLSDTSIMDLYPTIMKIMGGPLPHDLDGRVLDEVFEKQTPEVFQPAALS